MTQMDYQKIYDELIRKYSNNPIKKNKDNKGLVETHHIVPVSCGGKDVSSNRINLPLRYHFHAHCLLYMIYKQCGKDEYKGKMANAITKMNKGFNFRSSLYEYVRIQSNMNIGRINSIKQKGVNNSNYGNMWICNDLTKESKLIDKHSKIPDCWRKGRFQRPPTKEELERNKEANRGKIYITNGIETAKIKKDEKIPEGWWNGRTIDSESISRKLKEYNENKKLELQEKNYKIYHPIFLVYVSEGFDSVVSKFNYNYTRENLLQQFKKYIPEFKPQKGKRRRHTEVSHNGVDC